MDAPRDEPLWDETLYAGSAEFYAVGRLPYPQALADRLGSRLGLDRSGRLLDVGCGPGSLTLLLAPWFDTVIAVDADADMLRVGQARAADAGITNVEWLHRRAEQMAADTGPFGTVPFDVVTLAQSFHWMDQRLVAETVHRLLAATGCCVHVGATTHEGVTGADALPHPAPPRAAIADLVRSYLGPHRRAGQRVVAEELPSDEDTAFRAAGFARPERIEVVAGEVFTRSEDEIVASVLSLSSAAPHLFGPRLAEFQVDLRRLLRATAPGGVFSEQQRDITLSLWWP